MVELALDWTLALALVGIVWAVFRSRELFVSVVLFITFGLLLSLVWVRLGAPDVALAEAAIGAGLTGALLLDAVAQMGPQRRADEGAERLAAERGAPALAVAALLAILLPVAVRLDVQAVGLGPAVRAELAASGVTQPVTAVLLNFRALDTWLEVGVLLLAAVATLAVGGLGAAEGGAVHSPRTARDPMLEQLLPVLVPVMALIAGYLLWLGTHSPGGAFQAGAVLASAAVILILAGGLDPGRWGGAALRWPLVIGFLGFGLAAAATAAAGALLRWPPTQAGALILVVEVGVTISIAATLVVLFAGARAGQ